MKKVGLIVTLSSMLFACGRLPVDERQPEEGDAGALILMDAGPDGGPDAGSSEQADGGSCYDRCQAIAVPDGGNRSGVLVECMQHCEADGGVP